MAVTFHLTYCKGIAMHKNQDNSEKLILELYQALKNLEEQSAWKIWEKDELRVTARKALRKVEKKLKLDLTVIEDED
jgi:hypothetical protein